MTPVVNSDPNDNPVRIDGDYQLQPIVSDRFANHQIKGLFPHLLVKLDVPASYFCRRSDRKNP